MDHPDPRIINEYMGTRTICTSFPDPYFEGNRARDRHFRASGIHTIRTTNDNGTVRNCHQLLCGRFVFASVSQLLPVIAVVNQGVGDGILTTVFYFLYPIVVSVDARLVERRRTRVRPLMARDVERAANRVKLNVFLREGNFNVLIVLYSFLGVISVLIRIINVRLEYANLKISSNGFCRMRYAMKLTGRIGLQTTSGLNLFTIRFRGHVLIIQGNRENEPIGIFKRGILKVSFRFRALILRLASVRRVKARANDRECKAIRRGILDDANVMLRDRIRAIRRTRVRASVRIMVHFPFRVPVFGLQLGRYKVLRVTTAGTYRTRVTMWIKKRHAVRAMKYARFRVNRPFKHKFRRVLFSGAPYS